MTMQPKILGFYSENSQILKILIQTFNGVKYDDRRTN